MRVDSEISHEINLLSLWRDAYREVTPRALIAGMLERRRGGPAAELSDGESPYGALFWGKSAFGFHLAFRQMLEQRKGEGIFLGISPEIPERAPAFWRFGDHPLPGPRSLEAGRALIDFFDELRRGQARSLDVYLSGGASSLAWLPPAGMSLDRLRCELERLYSEPLTIRELNRRRARLCRLKAGGAAFLLQWLAPRVRTRVWLISDVLPYGPEVVGSGPFFDGKIPHRVLADNRTWVNALSKNARRHGIRVISASSGNLGNWQSWVQNAMRHTTDVQWRIQCGTQCVMQDGVMIFGGEPQVKLLRNPGKGGRQTQIASALAHEVLRNFNSTGIEILAMSSDGVDGTSGAAGSYLNSSHLDALSHKRKELFQAIRSQNTASLLSQVGALISNPIHSSDLSNLQDVLMVRTRAV